MDSKDFSLNRVRVIWVGSELISWVPPDLSLTLCSTFDDVLAVTSACDSGALKSSVVHVSQHLRTELSVLASALSDTQRNHIRTVGTLFAHNKGQVLKSGTTSWCLLVMMLNYVNWNWDPTIRNQYVLTSTLFATLTFSIQPSQSPLQSIQPPAINHALNGRLEVCSMRISP